MRLNEFDQTDYEIRNLKKLDSILVKLCEMIIEGQKNNSDFQGMVAAAVLDPDNNIVAATSTYEDGLWVHAEKNAMEAYDQEYGDIPEGSILLTTCSPCDENNDKTAEQRHGDSCTDLINNSIVRKVYCGYMDPSQGDDEHEEREFTLQETNNSHIRSLCEKFADTFLEEDELNESAAWHRKAGKNKNGGLNDKGIASYRREHPGSHLQKAVTTKPSKLKAGSKAAKRRKSFCARMGGVDGPMKKDNGEPTRKALALRKWNC